MPPKKPFVSKFKIQLPAGAATPAPPVGPVLGQHGVNIQAFCSEFNDKTQEQKKEGLTIPVICYVFEDKSFELEFKTPPASVLIKKELNIQKGSGKPNTEKIGKITRKQLENVATKKMVDLNANDMDAAVKIIAGTA
ncbi:50S ribosomal protein L11, partial [Candidatus Gracilibacteria bacterium]|nr:50S ribosomal protein L11 [Candidatus Gracilibacteria bacterium]